MSRGGEARASRRRSDGAPARTVFARGGGAPRLLRIVLLAALAVSTLLPLALLVLLSLGREWFYPALLPGRLTLQTWTHAAWEGGRLARAVAGSLTLAAGTGLLAAAVGFPVGRALATLPGWRRHVGAAAAFLPVAAPPVALAVGLQYTLLRAGLGGTFAGVLLAHLVPAAGYASLFFLGIFTVFDARVEEEARSLGAGPWQVLRRVTLPLLKRPLAEAFLLGFLVSWAQVPLTLVVGQGAVPTLPLEVLSYVQAGQDRLGATGALLLTFPPLVAIAAVALAARRAQVAAP